MTRSGSYLVVIHLSVKMIQKMFGERKREQKNKKKYYILFCFVLDSDGALPWNKKCKDANCSCKIKVFSAEGKGRLSKRFNSRHHLGEYDVTKFNPSIRMRKHRLFIILSEDRRYAFGRGSGDDQPLLHLALPTQSTVYTTTCGILQEKIEKKERGKRKGKEGKAKKQQHRARKGAPLTQQSDQWQIPLTNCVASQGLKLVFRLKTWYKCLRKIYIWTFSKNRGE